jgi:hypothetical protein
VPRAGHTAIDDFAFTQWTVLVAADVRNRRYFSVVLENRDTLPIERNNCGALLWNPTDRAGVYKPIRSGTEILGIHYGFPSRSGYMERDDSQ